MTGVLSQAFRPLPPPLDEQAASETLHAIAATAPALDAALKADERARNLLMAAIGGSGYLSALVRTNTDFAAACLRQPPGQLMQDILRQIEKSGHGAGDEAQIMQALRRAKARAALLLALADLARFWPLEEITAHLTRLAETALAAASRFALRKAAQQGRLTADDPAASGLIVLGMGKLGGHELNYSSDIDLIVLYDESRAPLAQGVEAGPFFVRLVRRIIRIMAQITEDGYVFRTDLRLRPDPGSTRIAISTEAALSYYQSLGQNWERAAMIKARPVAGDVQAAEAFLAALRPWIWRKYLDFAAIADVQALKRQIHAVKGHGDIATAGHNIKLGRGGIREIEFFVQTQQLIAGGRDPSLRGRSTLPMLEALAKSGWIAPEVAKDMASAYRYLRTLEHRLQMRLDQQTHTLPTDDAAMQSLARFCGHASREALEEELRAVLCTVQGHYQALFEAAPGLAAGEGALVFTGGEDDPETLQTLAKMGFARPADASALVRGWHYGRYRAMRSATARERLTGITPALLSAISRAAAPDEALAAFDRFLEGLPSGVQLFSLLGANPHLLDLLVMILGSAPLLASELSRRPGLFDAVLAADFHHPLPGRAAYERMLALAVAENLAPDEAMEAARFWAGEHKFRIGLRLISETVSPQEASAAYTALAEALIGRMLKVAREQMRAAHGDLPGARTAILAMGKLGGAEMTATSDLDLIVVHDYAADAAGSAGPRPIAPGLYVTRLTQRLITALSAPMSNGVLYEVDMRLRPSGSQGPVATHLESFIRYHQQSAWTWEHLALTRARVIAGDEGLRRQIEEVIAQTLIRPRDADRLRADVLDMRRRILEQKPPASCWDVKGARGGLIDMEFLVQALQLLHAREHPHILRHNTQEAIRALGEAGILRPQEMQDLLAAHQLHHHLSHILRLCVAEGFDGQNAPEGLSRLLANAASTPDLPTATARLQQAQEKVRKIFTCHIGGI